MSQSVEYLILSSVQLLWPCRESDLNAAVSQRYMQPPIVSQIRLTITHGMWATVYTLET